MTWLEAIGVLFGLVAVWLTLRQNVLCWPVGLVQVCIYGYIFYESKLYSDVILQVYFIFTQLYGWYYWLHGGSHHRDALVRVLSSRQRLGCIASGLLITLLWGWAMSRWTDAAAPYPDAFITVMSLIAQWLLTRKILESWHYWIAVDVVAIGVYWYKNLYLTAGLYSVFLVLAMMGLLAWHKSLVSARPSDNLSPA